MRYITLGQDDKELSEIVLGMMRIKDKSVKEVEELVETALSVGINAFDLADIYGRGRCEELLGLVLKNRPDLREKMWIQSKCGIRIEEFTYFDFSKDYIIKSVDGILQRLKIDHLDSLLLHRPDALMESDQVAEAFDLLYKQGKVRNFGVSNQNPMMMELLKKDVKQPLAVNQLQLSAAFTPGSNQVFMLIWKIVKQLCEMAAFLNIANYTMWSFKHGLSYNLGILKGILLEMRNFKL